MKANGDFFVVDNETMCHILYILQFAEKAMNKINHLFYFKYYHSQSADLITNCTIQQHNHATAKMCISHSIHYVQCGHLSQASYRACSRPTACGQVMHVEQFIDEGFCTPCFISYPDPRSTPTYTQLTPESLIWNPPGYLFTTKEQAEARLILERATEHMKDNHLDLLALVGTEFQQVGKSATAAIYRVNWLLNSHFWKQVNEGSVPSHQERMLILQLRTFVETWMLEETAAYLISPRRATHLQSLLTPVKIEALECDETDCAICSEVLGATNQEGNSEQAVKTPCGHLFGEHCIKSWLEENDNCPCCRGHIISNTDVYQQFWIAEAAAAETRGTPSWLITFVGCEPKDHEPTHFFPSAEDLYGIDAVHQRLAAIVAG
jgi:hypothetical protein